jgi:recombination protein RecA
MAEPVLHLVSEAQAATIPLAQWLEPARLVELAGDHAAACTTTAVALVRDAQLRGETTAWIQPRGGALYPPDVARMGVDLEALAVVQVPPSALPHGPCRAAELLLRSGGFGLVVVDLEGGVPPGAGETWQARLGALARTHQTSVILLSRKAPHHGSLGALVTVRIEPRRERVGEGRFAIVHHVIKNKSGTPPTIDDDRYRGPAGLI